MPQIDEGCRERVIAPKSPRECQSWNISNIEPHSCEQVGAHNEHCNITVKYVSHIMQLAVEEDINLGIRKLQSSDTMKYCCTNQFN